MPGINNAINNTIPGIASFGTSSAASTSQAAVTPSISAGSITTGLLINPVFTPSSGTLYGEQINPQFNPPNAGNYASVYGLSIAPTITPVGSGSVTNAYGLSIAGASITSGSVTNAYSLYVAHATGAGAIVNNYTAILGTSGSALVGIGTTTPAFTLDISGALSAHRVYQYSGLTVNNQLIGLAEGYNQGGYGGGSVGTNKQMSVNSTTCFDLAAVNAALLGFVGGVFDGRYVYLVPFGTSSASGTIARYDTTLPFYETNSYTAFGTTAVNSSSKEFIGGVFDGRYVYLVPFGGGSSGQITRYDTTQSFTTAASYTCFDTLAVSNASQGFNGGVFDGRYVYLVPYNTGVAHGTITRYDTTQSFTAAASYTCFDTLAVNSASKGFISGVFDGRYVYLVPNNNGGRFGQITRYDTAQSFTAAASYTCFDTLAVSNASKGFEGGVFDGRYVYLVPNNGGLSGTITRYDTTQSFTTAASYTCFDTTTVSSSSKGFSGGMFDGRYVYLVPSNNGAAFGTITRYDTTLPFLAAASYTCFDTTAVNANSQGFQGCVFDGRYVYLVPYNNSVMTRLDAYPGPQATAMAVSQAPNGFVIGSYVGTAVPPDRGLIVSGNVGIGTLIPAYTLDVNGTINVPNVIGISSSALATYATGGTTRNQLITLAEGYNQGGFGGGSVGTNKLMSAESTTCFEMAAVNGALYGFVGGVFDGRYVYLVPNSTSAASGTIARYDTTLPFYEMGSYTAFDTTAVSGGSRGFHGGVFDGRYVYLVPNDSGLSGTITRYDTTLSFVGAGSYTCFDTLTVHSASLGFQGAVFDGRYVYLVPYNNGLSGQITRYDTAQSFTAAAGYTCFDTQTVNNASLGFFGGVFDGRYVYLVPYNSTGVAHGTITRYDTAQSFTAAASYTCFDTMTVSSASRGFAGGVFDGRYVYLVPNDSGQSGTITRYDTTGSFTTAASYTCFDTTAVNNASKGFVGGVFDGRYVYLVPNNNGANFGTITRYDTTWPFLAAGSYTCFDTAAVNANSRGFQGCVFDGRYVYLVPNTNSVMTRLDAYPGPQATAIAVSQAPNGFAIGSYAGIATPPTNGLIVSGNVGIGVANPQYTVDVAGSVQGTALYSSSNLYATGGTTRNQLVTLFEGYNQGGYGGGMVGTNKLMGANTTISFDVNAVNVNLNRFQGGVFDGRYIYLVPSGVGASGLLGRYDTTLPFTDAGSYTAFDTAIVNINSKRFQGGVFDGRYVYLVPSTTPSFGQITRYDTTLSFVDAGSYTCFNTRTVNALSQGFRGGVFDGRYVYLVPNNLGTLGLITRYDTTLSFLNANSYTCFNTTTVNANSKGFSGGVFDGRYVYLVPNSYTVTGVTTISGLITRYDTAQSFTAAASYTCFDTTAVNNASKGFNGGVFDGRYVYLVPFNNGAALGTITRYDTTLSFLDAGSYNFFDTTTVNTNSKGFYGGVFDGRYVYLVPSNNGASFGQITRYDTTLSFTTAASYTFFNTATVNANSVGFIGGVFDGRYVYLIANTFGTLTRLDAYTGPQATAMAASQAPNGFAIGAYAGTNTPPTNGLIVSGNVGIGTASPQYALDVNGTINATAILVNGQAVSTAFRGLTLNNQLSALTEGYNQGGFGGGSVGTNKLMSVKSTASFDMRDVDAGAGAGGYAGAVFDGRYVYLIPGSVSSGTVMRYDTTLSINATGSYTSFNTLTVNANSMGFAGGVFDGRYVYLIPYSNVARFGQITRYDTTLPFLNANSYTCFNTTAVNANSKGFQGGVFDGRYVYLVPNNNGAAFGQITRYDTTLSFLNANSYAFFNTTTVSSSSKGFRGGVFDGRYVYLVPNNNGALFGTITRYDTALPFTTATSYTCFDTTSVNSASKGFWGGVFDGRYVYLVPNNNGAVFGQITRYDTTQSFTTAASYTCFDTQTVNNSSQGFRAGVFDGRYVYLAPRDDGSGSNVTATITRYDTTQSFFAAASYTCFNARNQSSLNKAFMCGVFDGRYIYLAGEGTQLTRLGAYTGPQATAMAASQAPNGFAVGTYAGGGLPNVAPSLSYHNAMIVSGNVGIGTATPTFSLHLALDSAAKPSTNTWTITSDVRIKRNIQDIPDALTKITQLRPRKFQYHPAYAKDTGLSPDKYYYGFVADEVELALEGCVFPSNIHCYNGQMKEWLDRGASGPRPEPVPGLTNLKCFNIHNILIHYIQAIKELSEKMNQLQQELDNLKP
ncbi:MAG: hypothetical protein HW387_1025 [Parachlamydiales bacterium]|nr:hypothetical protein [Parachlamydiales bacterium]